MTNLLEQTKEERIEEIIRHRTANFTAAQIAEWAAAAEEDVLPIIGVLFMKGIVRRESKTEWAVI